MGAMDARRLELYELLKPKLDEEPAKQLVLALPADPDSLVTKDHLDERLDAMELRFDAREARIINTLTWRMILVMGAWTAVATSLFGFLGRVI